MGIIQRQGIKNTISSYLGILLGFVSLIIIQPKFLKPEEIGLARVLFAFSTLIASFIPIGVTNMTIKYFPYFRNHKNGHNGFFGFMLIFPIIGFIISASGLYIFRDFVIAQYRRESPLIIDFYNYIFPFSLFIAFSTVVTTYLIALFKSTVPSYINDLYTRLAYIGLIFLYYFNYLTLGQFMGAYVGIYSVQLLLLIFYLVKEDKPSLIINWDFFKQQGLKEMISFGLLLSFSSIAALGLKTLDSVLIGKFLPLSFVGIYAIASFIPTIIETPLNALDRIVTAKVAHAIVENDIAEVKDVFYKSVKYLSLIGALLFVGINCNITFLLSLVGKDFEQGYEVVWIISVGALINMMGGANGSIVFYSSKYWQGALLLLLLVVITFACNMLLIPRFGINGAAMSTAISSLLYTGIRLFITHRKFGFQPFDINTVKTIAILLFCLALNYVLPVFSSAILNIIFRSVVLGGSFLVITYFLKIVPEFHHFLPWERNK
ncbi:MAG TPA: polysaccharide biosynthesis C-terminal domain-containing protein [Chitinophagales bacterium]|nr:polysaccharide biosynthesis C-terminal domain-containing protein [Chitinophagales bacterium]